MSSGNYQLPEPQPFEDTSVADALQVDDSVPYNGLLKNTTMGGRRKPRSKYDRRILEGVYVDVYEVLIAFNVTCPAIAHGIKKLLAPGQRGSKTLLQDLKEARSSINRAIELEENRL